MIARARMVYSIPPPRRGAAALVRAPAARRPVLAAPLALSYSSRVSERKLLHTL